MKIKLLLLFFGFLFIKTLNARTPPEEEGKTIFVSRCASCHNVNKTVVGPALSGVDDRRSMDWIVNFVQSSQTLVKKGDKDAVDLFKKFNNIPMPDHLDLTHDNIKNVVAFIKSEGKSAAAEKATIPKPTIKRPAFVPLSIQKDLWFFTTLLFADALLIGALLLAVKVSSIKNQMENKRLQAGPIHF